MAPPQQMCIFCAELVDNILTRQDLQNPRDTSKVLVNVWELLGFPLFDLQHQDLVGACELCLKRVDYLLSAVQKVKLLESQINEVLNQVYTDLRNDFRAIVAEDVRQDLRPAIKHREKAAAGRRHLVCELKPVSATLEELIEVDMIVSQDQSGAETASLYEDSQDAFPADLDEADHLNFYLAAIDPEVLPEVLPEGEAGVFVCDYKNSEGQKCDSVFPDKRKFDAHLASHTLRIHLGQDTVRNYMPTLVKSYWKNSAAKLRNKNFKCPHLDCAEFENMPFDDFKEHLKETHSLYVCSLTAECLRKRVMFDSQEEINDHVEFIHNQTYEEGLYPIETASDNLIKCSGCAFSYNPFSFRWEFGRHLIRIHKHYVCLHEVESGSCLNSFPAKEAFISHFHSKHGLQASMQDNSVDQTPSFLNPHLLYEQCFVCGQHGFTSNTLFVEHVKEQHGLLMCGQLLASYRKQGAFCQQVFDTDNLLQLHRTICRSNGKFEKFRILCKCCKRILAFPDRKSWLKHVKDDHNGLVCGILNKDTDKFCDEMSLSRTVMKHHIEEKHSEEIDLATTDGLTFKLYSEGFLDKVPGLPMIGPAICQICSQSFANFNQEWAQHVRSHGLSVCDIQAAASPEPCLQVFRNINKLRAHIASAHMPRSTSTTNCPECNQDFNNKSEFLEHIARHSGSVALCAKCGRARSTRRPAIACTCSKTIECDVCAKTFVSVTSLKSHKQIVHEGRRWSCETCGKQFANSTNLDHHVDKVHQVAVEITHKCSECERTYATPGLRDQHFKRAHGPRKYNCDRCDWAFRTSQQLSVHIRKVHENLRPFICDVCGGTFKSKGQLDEHLRRHESGLIKKPFKPKGSRPLRPPPPSESPSNVDTVGLSEPMDVT